MMSVFASMRLKGFFSAIERGEIADVRARLAKGAEINARSEEGLTPLMLASRKGHCEMVRALIDNGADVNAKVEQVQHTDYYNQRALFMAAKRGYLDVVKTLLDRGAKIDAENGFPNQTALMAACEQGHFEVVQILIDNLAKINAKDLHGRTALFMAAKAGRPEVVQALLDKGAQVRVRASWVAIPREDAGRTVLGVALNAATKAVLSAHTRRKKAKPEPSESDTPTQPAPDGATDDSTVVPLFNKTPSLSRQPQPTSTKDNQNFGLCDQCGNRLKRDEGYAVYSDVRIATENENNKAITLWQMGNMMICETCADGVFSERAFNAPKKYSGTVDVSVPITALNDEAIVARCKRMRLSPTQAKKEARGLALDVYKEERSGKIRTVLFWKQGDVGLSDPRSTNPEKIKADLIAAIKRDDMKEADKLIGQAVISGDGNLIALVAGWLDRQF
jgi:hypothetical protein